MPPAERRTDITAHGGSIVFGAPTVLIGGLPAARVGDPHVCPMVNGPVVHTGGVINTGSPTVFIGGAMAARMGDQCHCLTVGAAGVAVPQQVGPGLADEVHSESGPGHSETRFRDPDNDGN